MGIIHTIRKLFKVILEGPPTLFSIKNEIPGKEDQKRHFSDSKLSIMGYLITIIVYATIMGNLEQI